MRIVTPFCPEIAAEERGEPICPLRCPVCSGALIPLHNNYRCSRCSYQFCAGCEAIEPEPIGNPLD